MKRTLLLTALSAAFLFSNNAQAQIPGVSKVTKALPKVDLGLKIGGNFQKTTGDFVDNSFKPGITGGAFVGIYKNKIGVQAEALIKSAKIDIDNGAPTKPYLKTINLDIPILFEYKVIPRVWLQAGPQFSQILSAKDNAKADVKSNLNTTEFSGVIGAQVKLPVHLVAGARYIMSFTDINNYPTTVGASTDEWKTRSIQVYVGFRFL